MRLDFNVLWVDDQPERVVSLVKPIATHMEGHGFEFNKAFCRTIDDVREHLSQDVFTDQIDLVLVDWDLGGEVRGQDAIAAIRDKIQYKDIVFYSAQTTPDELREHAHKARLEGVFCVARESLVDEVMGVFDSLVKKVLDLDHTRGIVMGATSDIDHIVNECLAAIHAKSDTTMKDALIADMLAMVSEQLKKFEEGVRHVESVKTIEAIFEAHGILQSYDRLRVLCHALEHTAMAPYKGFRPAVTTYMQKVVRGRNILGHKVLVPAGSPQAVVDNKDVHITLDQTLELRRSILTLRQQFRDLLAALRTST